MLSCGTKLGPYEIQSPLGAGGMGEVYRARDTRLDRTVAIKILPSVISADPIAKQRFEREAKTISSLNHPNICVLHDVGSQDGTDYQVLMSFAKCSGDESHSCFVIVNDLLYGITAHGGDNNQGVIFSFNPATSTPTPTATPACTPANYQALYAFCVHHQRVRSRMDDSHWIPMGLPYMG